MGERGRAMEVNWEGMGDQGRARQAICTTAIMAWKRSSAGQLSSERASTPRASSAAVGGRATCE